MFHYIGYGLFALLGTGFVFSLGQEYLTSSAKPRASKKAKGAFAVQQIRSLQPSNVPVASADGVLEPVKEPTFEIATIHYCKIPGDGRLVLYVYPTMVRRHVCVWKSKDDFHSWKRGIASTYDAAPKFEEVSNLKQQNRQVQQMRIQLPDLPLSPEMANNLRRGGPDEKAAVASLQLLSRDEIEKTVFVKHRCYTGSLETRQAQRPISASPELVMPEMLAVAKIANVPASSVIADPELESYASMATNQCEEDAFDSTNDIVHDAPAAIATPTKRTVNGKAQEEWVGFVQDIGEIRRTVGAGKPFNDFQVLLVNDEGVEESVFGRDLDRLVQQKKIEVGSKVRIRLMGRKAVGEAKFAKKLFDMEVLAA